MSGAVMNKILDFLGMETAEEEELEEVENEYTYEYLGEDEPEERKLFGKRNKVVNMPQVQQIRMVISQPTSFEQSEEICNYLKEKKSVIINLEYVNKDVARRIVDFMSGAVQALNGHIEKVSNSIFLFAPFNYEIAMKWQEKKLKIDYQYHG